MVNKVITLALMVKIFKQGQATKVCMDITYHLGSHKILVTDRVTLDNNPLHSASMGGYPSAPPHGIAPPPGADPTLWNWFITVDNDKSGQITSNELKQALVNGNWTHFNDETCRLMISMFDKDQSGTINFQEFCNLWTYIQQWKGVFDRYDMDHSGAIETHELQTALNDMGYRLSPIFTNILITRFDTVARRSMKLDSFIQCCVMLRLLTDAFRLRDTNLTGIINVSYEDFMCMVIENKS
ncbi:peflin-like [Xenia sp. Carnegie-2017]|uniref:peflin-like n=1 Tax=Xenia sp. Carnegie-2017 TaxID=2897299 RepID=UPI001F045EC3|nr:peflin-like [Xenia sp. Carnegie-2017]